MRWSLMTADVEVSVDVQAHPKEKDHDIYIRRLVLGARMLSSSLQHDLMRP